MSHIELRLEPTGNEDNKYATPCYFAFKDIEEATPFIRTVMNHGDRVDIYMREVVNED